MKPPRSHDKLRILIVDDSDFNRRSMAEILTHEGFNIVGQVRFVFYFTLSFAILCIPIGSGNHLFDKLLGMVTPYADKAMNTTKQKLSTTKRYSRKLYSNSEPFEKDEIQTKLAGIQKIQKKIQ